MSGKLYNRIREHKDGHKVTLDDLTVLAAQNDPYRLDTASGHRDAQWLKEQFDQAIGSRQSIHLRGLHYAIVARGDVVKPNGKTYVNSDEDWTWLQVFPAKAARWLGYVPFDKIRDQRNDPPVIHRQEPKEHRQVILVGGLSIHIPQSVDLKPEAYCRDLLVRQPYHLVIFGEKSSLAEVVLPIAERFKVDAYLMTGEITDTYLHQIARDAALDGRPMRLFTLSDCDPAGHQMPVSIGRKLQALRDLEFHDLDFEVRQIALTVDQVRDLGLPSTPLKESERRAGKWREAFGVEQTEIDALATLQPNVLRQIIIDALEPFHDETLHRRVTTAKAEWEAEAQRIIDQRIDQNLLDHLHQLAEKRLDEIRKQIHDLERDLEVPVPDDIVLPDIAIPEPVVDENLQCKPLVSSSWSWLEATAALKAHKGYGGGAR